MQGGEVNSPVRLSFVVRGMSCAACASVIESHLSRIDGIVSVFVNFAALRADVEFSAGRESNGLTAASLRSMHSTALDSIRSLGFQAEPLTLSERLYVSGMTCAGCAYSLEQRILDITGILEASVSFTTSSVDFTFIERVVSPDIVRKAVSECGFRIVEAPVCQEEEGNGFEARDEALGLSDRAVGALSRTDEIDFYKRRFLGSLLFSFPLVVCMFISMTDPIAPFAMEYAFTINFVYMLFATPCVVVFGREYFLHAYANLRHFRFTMDTLVAFGVGGAYVFSLIALLLQWIGIKATCYFDTAAELITFMLLGRLLEAIAKARTGDALVLLLKLTPAKANVVRTNSDGIDEIVSVPSSSLKVGDRVQVATGEHIPVDGTVVDGMSEVDESAVTGEAVPRTVSVGSKVIGGTVNMTCGFRLVATAVGSSTVVSKIIRVVEEAQRTKPAIQRFADRIASVFVPCVIGISLSVFVVWALLGYFEAYPSTWRGKENPYVFAFENFLSTLVVACPCALGLATPTAIMVGTGVGAEMGVLSKSGLVLETAPMVRTFIFDKTGTLTQGRLDVTSAIFFETSGRVCEPGHFSASDLVLVAAVESLASHPIAAAVTRKIQSILPAEGRDQIESVKCLVTSHTVIGGKGVQAELRGEHLRVGTMAFIQEAGAKLPVGVMEALSELGKRGRTIVLAAVDTRVVAIFGLADTPKLEARDVISYLTSANHKVMMVTGDNRPAALRIAREVGISEENVRASCLPADKEAVVFQEQQGGIKVAFIGDGTNDSPALTQADIGIALGAGTDVAVECADAVLMHDSLHDIIAFLGLASAVVRRVRFNFAWALGYNALMLPAAAGVFYPIAGTGLPPVVAGLAMIFSSLSVLASSLALRCHTVGRPRNRTGYALVAAHADIPMETVDFDGEELSIFSTVRERQNITDTRINV